MSDADVRELERAALASPDDVSLRRTWREALLRAGREGEAGIEVGDVVHQKTDPALEDMRDGSEYDDGDRERGWFSLVVKIQNQKFTSEWPWRKLDAAAGLRILGTAFAGKTKPKPVALRKGTVVIFAGAQDSVRLVRPNAVPVGQILGWRYLHDEGDYEHNAFRYGPEKGPDGKMLPQLGPWPMEYGELRCDAWGAILERLTIQATTGGPS